ncbi:hypothetical protein GCG21_03220 [Pseudactinotalea sp. HY160]|uniref:hypothetical protein n=1 Tax=Pseudactinotalea sp. HY160 TaxID=2654490 RepID=UPI00128C3F78|nr:hypothetical protein [Pseudactinotalea sp. HY160]MPV49033.1 hypothetical protein [Pseudactinotalea sp. HY160]
MERRVAKELVHIRGWLERTDQIVARGRATYVADDLLQEAGDSLQQLFAQADAVIAVPPDGVGQN